MDIATLLGFFGGIGCLLFAMLMGSGISTFIHIPSMLIVVGGTFSATLINFPLPEIMKILSAAFKAFKSDALDPLGPIPLMISAAETTRREGLLSLENSVDDIEDDFLKLGMRLIIDGTDPEEVRGILETELDCQEERHNRGQQLFLAMAKYAPGFGMIGTLVGLIALLKNMNDPSNIGPAMSVALITTFYGAVLANLIFMPIAGKLKARTADESLIRRIVLEGILMIQAQTNPRYISQKLVAYLPPKWRESVLHTDRQRLTPERNETTNETTNE